VFAGLGVALTVCGLLGVIWGDGAATKFVSGLVLVIGLVQTSSVGSAAPRRLLTRTS
jgi:hypothetical protein